MSEKLEVKAAIEVTDAGEITGTAWPFSGPDRVGDVITKGAFTAPAKLPMLWSHDQAEVIGVWDQIQETAEGLTVKGKLLVDSVERAREVHAMIKAGAVSGLSIGFVTKQAQRHGKGRTITALDLREVSIVAVPSHPDAQITYLKSESTSKEFSKVENEELTPEVETETKAQTPANDAPQIDMKAFDAMKARLEKLEAKSALKAPAVIQGDFEEKSAFVEYLQTGVETKALTTANDTANHVLAPEEVSAEFLRNLVEYSPIRAIADVRSTSAGNVILPQRTGITNAAWVSETGNRSASQPSFSQMSLPVHELATYVDMSVQLAEDSDNVLSEVNLALAEDFGQKEALAFVEGVAANGEPAGFMLDANIDTLTAASGTAIDPDELIALMYSMPATYRNAGTWVMNGSTLAAIRTLKNGSGDYIWQPSYQAGQPETILGRPVIEAVDMPDIATTESPIIFGDFKRGYRIYDRVSLAVLVDPYTVRASGQVRYHARRRVGAGVVRPDAFRKLVMAAA